MIKQWAKLMVLNFAHCTSEASKMLNFMPYLRQMKSKSQEWILAISISLSLI